MQIDAQRIRRERERRAWSQEHLASVTELSLRTIQRVEANGAASYETARALAVVFAVEVVGLMSSAPAVRRALSRTARRVAAGLSAVLLVSVFLARDAFAGPIMLNVSLSLNDAALSQHHLIVEDGANSEIRLEGQLRLVVTPTQTPQGVMLAMQLFEFSGTGFELLATPALLAPDDEEAAVQLESAKGLVYRIAIKPHRM